MKITIELTATDNEAINQIAKTHGISPERVGEKLKNIYLANLTDDLSWIDEMLEEDAQNV